MKAFAVLAALALAACSAGKSSSSEHPGEAKPVDPKPGLKESGVLLPTGDEVIDPALAQADHLAARAKSGTREPFQASFDAGVGLLPSAELTTLEEQKLHLSAAYGSRQSQVATTETVTDTATATTTTVATDTKTTIDTATDVDVGGADGGGAGDKCDEKGKICAEACATATAAAYAVAFAHASVTACAWAEAWACAFTFNPFNQVCSWAQSEACASAFATAFGFGFGFDSQTVCDKQCK